MPDQVQCPNCGGYKTTTRSKEDIVGKRPISASGFVGREIVLLLFGGAAIAGGWWGLESRYQIWGVWVLDRVLLYMLLLSGVLTVFAILVRLILVAVYAPPRRSIFSRRNPAWNQISL